MIYYKIIANAMTTTVTVNQLHVT